MAALLPDRNQARTGAQGHGNAIPYMNRRSRPRGVSRIGKEFCRGLSGPPSHRDQRLIRTAEETARKLIASINPLGNRSTSIFDAAGRGVASVNPLNKRTTTVFDAASEAIGRVDALGNRSTSVYDAAGRTVSSINALGNRSTTVYDAAS